MAYRVDLSPGARRELRGLDSGTRDRILRALVKLETEPRPPGAKKLKGPGDELWRVRVGDYRVVYEVRDRILVVLVVRVAHRREVYR
ncbi:MAG TPA: type II toxin-antitoxin system RelE/ParE family toxin [Candidatus Binataceae bacterium]|nr:type II toxin-antitoxin system RelE/ParE family toxin [Candidatus Binataceae bacterium]